MKIARLTLWTVIGLSAALTAAPARATVREAETFQLEVSVTDKRGRPVHGLGPADFELLVDGEPIEPAGVRAVREGTGRDAAVVVVFVDNLHLGLNKFGALEDLHGFLRQRLGRDDQVLLVSFDGGVRLDQDLTSEWAPLEHALGALAMEPSSGPALLDQEQSLLNDMMNLSDTIRSAGGNHCPDRLIQMTRNYSNEVMSRVQASLSGLTELVTSLASLPGRKVLVHLSDGIPFRPAAGLYEVLRQYCGGQDENVHDDSAVLASLGLTNPAVNLGVYDFRRAELEAASVSAGPLLDELARRANARQVTFFPVEAGGPAGLSAGTAQRWLRRSLSQRADEVRAANRRQPLKAMAEATGGRAIVDARDLTRDLDRISQDLDNYYTLDFALPTTEDDRTYDVKVEVRGPGLQVRHRRAIRGQTPVERLAGQTQAALLYDRVDNPLAIGVEADAAPVDAAPGVDGLHRVLVRIRIPLANVTLQPEADGHHSLLRVFVSGRDREGRVSPVRSVEVPITIPSSELEAARSLDYLYEVKMLMRPGRHKVAIGVHDDLGTVASFVTEEVLVAAR